MANVIDYVAASQYESFYDKDFTILDALALTELTYLPFEELVPTDISCQTYLSLQKLAIQFEEKFQEGFPPLGMVNAHRLKLFSYLSTFTRYKQIHAMAFASDYSLDSQKQFAAMTYQIRPKEYLVVFRGTDDTLIGWKEDFHMTYMEEIPAQIAAKEYLCQILQHFDGRIWLAGHSKGGNLATYAASQVEPVFQNRIKEIFCFDAPGLHTSIMTSAGYQAIEDKIQAIIPENSIVGMMLETPETDVVVKSKTFGLLQHITFSWQVEGDHFVEVPKVTDDSVQVDQTLKAWTASLTQDELRDFFDLFFGIFIEAGIQKLGDFTIDTPAKIQKVIENSQNLTAQQKNILDKVSRQLIDTRMQVWKEHLPSLPNMKDFHPLDQLQTEIQEKIPNLENLNIPDKIRSMMPDKNKDQS